MTGPRPPPCFPLAAYLVVHRPRLLFGQKYDGMWKSGQRHGKARALIEVSGILLIVESDPCRARVCARRTAGTDNLQ